MTIPANFRDPRLPERFWKRCEPITETGCWIWTGTTIKDNRPYIFYGRNDKGKKTHILAYRWAYLALIGPIPPKLGLDHKCAIKECVNPNHLEPVTHAENVKRMGGTVYNNWASSKKYFCKWGHPINRDKWGGCIECGKERSRVYEIKRKNARQKARSQS